MAIFLLAGMPLLGLLVGAAAVAGRLPALDRNESAGDLAWQFLAGLVAALPSLALLLALRGVVGLSYRAGRLYFAVALVEQLLPVALAVGCYLLLHLAPFFGRSRESLASSFELAVFLCGFFSAVSLADYVSERGELTGHVLLLLPVVRFSEIVLFARALPRLVEAQRWRKAVPALAMAVWPLLAAFEGLWSRQGRDGAAIVLTAGLALVAAAGVLAWSTGGTAGVRLRRRSR